MELNKGLNTNIVGILQKSRKSIQIRVSADGKHLLEGGKVLQEGGKVLRNDGKGLQVNGKPLQVFGKVHLIDGNLLQEKGKDILIGGKHSLFYFQPILFYGNHSLVNSSVSPRIIKEYTLKSILLTIYKNKKASFARDL